MMMVMMVSRLYNVHGHLQALLLQLLSHHLHLPLPQAVDDGGPREANPLNKWLDGIPEGLLLPPHLQVQVRPVKATPGDLGSDHVQHNKEHVTMCSTTRRL